MAITVSTVVRSSLPGGRVLVAGLFTFDNVYATGGETMDLSAYLLGTSTPLIVVSGDDGWMVQGDRGTASANKVLCYGSADTNAAVNQQAAVSTDLSAVIGTFIAIGTAA